MRKVDFEVSERLIDGVEIFSVAPPDIIREKLIPLHEEGAKQLGQRLGTEPARASMTRWRSQGYPLYRDGPRVRLPCVTQLKKVYTSTAALSRWMTVVANLNAEIEEAGGVQWWRAERKAGTKLKVRKGKPDVQ